MRRLLLWLLLIAPGWARPEDLQSVENLPEQQHIFHPTRGLQVRPEDTGLPLQNLYLQAEDGVRLNGWWLKGQPTVLYFHGNGGNLASTVDTLRLFRQAGLGALVIDYRGYGLSEGRPSEEGVYRDARAAYAECLRRKISPDRLLIHGQSLGGAVAAQLASEKKCAGLILESTFSDAPAMARRMFGEVAAGMVHSRFATRTKVSALTMPLLVIHGTADETIPCEMGREIYAGAAQPKELWIVEGAGHNNLRALAGAEYVRRLKAFVRRCVKP